MSPSHSRRRQSLVPLFLTTVAIIGACTLIAYRTFSRPAGILGRLDHRYAVIDLTRGGYRVVPAVALTDESFGAMMERIKPYAAITGTYYGPGRVPLGDVVVGGKVIRRGFQRQGIGFRRDGRIVFLERKPNSRIKWSGCESGVACGPRLVRNGRIDIDVRRDGFRSGATTVEATRCAVGATRDGKLVMLAILEPVTLKTLAQAMLELGAVDATNMDGGSMCSFYEDGRYYAEPVLPVSNVLAIYRMK